MTDEVQLRQERDAYRKALEEIASLTTSLTAPRLAQIALDRACCPDGEAHPWERHGDYDG